MAENIELYKELMEESYIDDTIKDNIQHRYDLHTKCFTPDECDSALAELSKFTTAPGLVGYEGKHYVDPVLRICDVTYARRNEDNEWIHARMEQGMLESNAKLWDFEIADFSQPIRIMSYGAENHFNSVHQDIGPGQTCYRKLTAILFCSEPEEYEGGELIIYGSNFDYKEIAKKGNMIVFPAYKEHHVTPITSGRRNVIIFRAIGPAFR